MKTNNQLLIFMLNLITPRLSFFGMIPVLSATRLPMLAFGIWCGLVSVSSAQTIVTGPTISGGTWSPSGNPFIITGNCTINGGETLAIQPGVVVEIGSGLSITNNGLIQAVGTPSQHITFQSTISSQFWNVILNTYSGGTNIFNYCDFQNANTALSFNVVGSYFTMVSQILNCTFSNCLTGAVYGQVTGQLVCCSYAGTATLNTIIKNCAFNGTSNGIVLNVSGINPGCVCGGDGRAFAYPSILNNVFQNLAGGAFIMEIGNSGIVGSPIFVNNTVVGCKTGVNITDPLDATIQDNIFVGCTNAIIDLGSLSRQVSYNDFFGNATNFLGYASNTYGQIIWVNRNATPADVLYNIYQNPLFVAANNFSLTNLSPCANAGTPDTAYVNLCFPPSIATNYPDLGAYGGPDACNWLNSPPLLPAQLSLTKSNNLIWLNFGAIPRSTYQVQSIATNFDATSGTNRWLTNTILTPVVKPVSVAVSSYPATNKDAFYRVRSLGRTPGN